MRDQYKIKPIKRGCYNLEDFKNIFQKIKQTDFRKIVDRVLEVYAIYREEYIPTPAGLKGDIGELLVMDALKTEFPEENIMLLGGTYPGFDILLRHLRIDVKTFFYKPEIYEEEGCPTIRHGFQEKCDFIVLVEVYLAEAGKLDDQKTKIYIFNQQDMHYFRTDGCWTYNQGDCTICYFPKPIPDTKLKELEDKSTKEWVKVYNTDEYRNLFENAARNWEKMKKVLNQEPTQFRWLERSVKQH